MTQPLNPNKPSTWTDEIEALVARKVCQGWTTTVLGLAEKLMSGEISQLEHDEQIYRLKQIELRSLTTEEIAEAAERTHARELRRREACAAILAADQASDFEVVDDYEEHA